MLSSDDANLVQRDSVLPSLATLLDPAAFAARLGALLPGVDWDAARATYIRYKPGTSCLAAYQVRFKGNTLHVHAKGYGLHAHDKIRKSKQRLSNSTTGPDGSAGIIVLEDSALTIFLFPNDNKVKGLGHLTDTNRRRQLLRTALPDHPQLWNATVTTLAYKPERRYVGQLMVDGQPRAILKAYASSMGQAPLQKAMAMAIEPCALLKRPRPIGHLQQPLMILPWLSGQPLDQILQRPEPPIRILEAVGAALARLHSHRGGDLPCVTRHMEMTTLRQIAKAIGFVCPRFNEQVQVLAAQIGKRLGQESAVCLPIHGDFYAKQVLVDGDAIAFVDFDEAALGDPAADLGNFIAHLEYEAIGGKLSATCVQPAAEALLTGYPNPTDRRWFKRVALYQAAALLRLAPHPFRVRHPAWPQQTEALLQRTEQLFRIALAHGDGNKGAGARHEQATKREQPSSVPVDDPIGVTTDPQMPFLKGAIDPIQVQRQIEQGLPPLTHQARRIRVLAIRVTRHKTGRRCMIDYDMELRRPGRSPERFTLVGKARARGLDQSTYQHVCWLWANGFADDAADGVCVPQPMGTIPDFHMWLQRKVPGTTATSLLTEPGSEELARRIAFAAHKLHNANIRPQRRHTMDDELRILRDRLSKVARAQPKWSRRLETIFEASRRLGQALPQTPTTGIHRDFYADQVLVDGSRLFLIDLDMYCLGNPGLDIGNFLGHITEQRVRTVDPAAALAAAQQAMEQAFVQLGGEHAFASVRTYAALTLVRHIYLSTLFPDRRPYTERLIELSEQHLDLATTNNLACRDHGRCDAPHHIL